jgi:hypothetical protein
MAKYEMWVKELKRYKSEIANGTPVKVDVRDESLNWRPMIAIISEVPIEGGEETVIVCEGGPVSYIRKPVYLKIVQELDEDEYVISDMDKYNKNLGDI